MDLPKGTRILNRSRGEGTIVGWKDLGERNYLIFFDTWREGHKGPFDLDNGPVPESVTGNYWYMSDTDFTVTDIPLDPVKEDELFNVFN